MFVSSIALILSTGGNTCKIPLKFGMCNSGIDIAIKHGVPEFNNYDADKTDAILALRMGSGHSVTVAGFRYGAPK